ncbi:TPA: hypothetical protein ACX6SH_000906 [Photobacterium damselae]
MKLFILDIDGLLIDEDQFDRECYIKAINQELNIQVTADELCKLNVTDASALDHFIECYQIKESRSVLHRQVEKTYYQLLRQALIERNYSDQDKAKVHNLFSELKARKDLHLAVVSSHWGSIAKLKLWAMGIELNRLTFASASDALHFVDVVALASFRAKQDAGELFAERLLISDAEAACKIAKELKDTWLSYEQAAALDINIAYVREYEAA